MTDDGTVDKEKHMKQLKRKMECWREIILPLNSILLWERSWHPGLIFGFITVIFCTIWILEPTMLTIISICLLTFALVDYFVPILTSVLCNTQSWTGQKEKKLIEICQNLSGTILQMQNTWISISKMRHDRPNIKRFFNGRVTNIYRLLMDYSMCINMLCNVLIRNYIFISCIVMQYYGATILCLILFAWIGNTVNNLFLLYIAVTVILLIPGLKHKGRARSAMRCAYDHLIRRHLS